ncbi:MAG: hypothetical protein LBK75_08735 [Oscillospiraceae bacterium]|jgi:hypothetical protein|nr:hypothetical protein [Oscillospiraceae bacterium]
MLDAAAFIDLRGYLKRRITRARYRVGSAYYSTDLTDITILSNGTVRAQLSIIPGGTVTVNRVELLNSESSLWAHQDVNIMISTGQTGILFWFDFTITEEAG